MSQEWWRYGECQEPRPGCGGHCAQDGQGHVGPGYTDGAAGASGKLDVLLNMLIICHNNKERVMGQADRSNSESPDWREFSRNW